MGRVLTDATNLNVAREASLGTLTSPNWLKLQPNDITSWGPKYKKSYRDPIAKTRQMEKGVVVDVDSAVGLSMDYTQEHGNEFLEGFLFSERTGPKVFAGTNIPPTAVTSTGYTVASAGALTEGWLIHAKGFATAANNGLKVVGSSSTGTEIKTSGLTTEAAIPASQNASVEVAGVQGATADIVMTAGGNLTSTVLDFTTLSLTVGQYIKIGGSTTATKFATAANNGYARISVIAAGQLTLDWASGTFAADVGTGKTIQLLFGQFLRNVDPDHADFLERSYAFEVAWEGLADGGGDEYEYAYGNYCNELAINLPTAEKVGMTLGFIGTTTAAPSETRDSDAANARVPVSKGGFNTTNDMARLRIAGTDEVGDTTYFKSLNLSIGNGVTPVKVIGTMGAAFMNYGKLKVQLDGEMLFTSSEVLAAIAANTTMALQFGIANDDGGIYVDIPALTVENGDRKLPRGETVTVSLGLMAHKDTTLGYSMGISFFPYLP